MGDFEFTGDDEPDDATTSDADGDEEPERATTGGADGDGDPDRATTGGVDDTAAATADGDLLSVTDLDAGYGDLQVLYGVDMALDRGEYVAVVGPNGAGKSTVMKSIFGLATRMGGRVVFDGQEVTDLPPEEIIRRGISYVPQNDNIFSGLTVRENLEMGAYILDSVPADRIAAVYERFPILEERADQRAGSLSGGQQQMVAMGRALMLDPDLLMLDEPSAGLAPDLVADMFDRIDAVNDGGTAILMVEQNAKEALRRCDRGYVLAQGRNRFTDTGQALLDDEEVRREFLGG